MSNEHNQSSFDLRGISRLAVDGVVGATNVIESFGQSIAHKGEPHLNRNLAQKPDETNLSSNILDKVRRATRWTGNKAELPLTLINKLMIKRTHSPKSAALRAVMNGVLGDHLRTTNNPLAIDMQFRRSGVSLNEIQLKELITHSNGRLLIMIHGSCMNDLQWHHNDHNHAEMLASELVMTPLYLHYNSGLHISDNGKKLSSLIESLVSQVTFDLEINIVAHSMGGLVARSACVYAKQSKFKWLKNLRKIIFLGTPHHGAPLEKAGNWIDLLLTKSRYSLAFARIAKIRSAGITDLRYGNILEQDWNTTDRFAKTSDKRIPVPLPSGVDCYAIAGCIAKKANKLNHDLVGDGLVTVPSALGQHKDSKHNLFFLEEHQWLGREIGHMELLSDRNVYRQIKSWLCT